MGANNVTLGALAPFLPTAMASGEVYLAQAGGCVDIGDDIAAPAGWDSLTILFAGTLDSTPVDAGRSFDPAQWL